MAIFTASALAAFAWKALIAGSLGLSVNSLLGNRFGNLFGGQGFKSDYDLEMDEYNKNQNTRTRTRGNFFNFNRRNQTTGQTRRDGILSFLGDRSRKLDDAPDIVEKNENVLSGIKTFGFGGLLPQSNPVPNIDNERVADPSYEGVRKEIEKINRNIDAIKSAMLSSASIEAEYRKQMIEDMQQALAEKGKDRSQTRSEKSIFNLITRPVRDVERRVGTLANELTKAVLFSLGLEVAGAMSQLLGGGEGGEGGEGIPPTATGGIKAGDYVKINTKRGSKYRVWDGEKFGAPTNVLPKGGSLIDVPADTFTPMTMEDVVGGSTDNVESGSDVSQNVSSNFNLGDSTITGDSIGNIDFTSMFNSSNNISRRSVEPGSTITEVIDLRTLKGDTNVADKGGATTVLNNDVARLDPSKGSSIYEMYVRSG